MELNKTREAVEYRVKEKSLIGNEMFEAGAIAKYDGLPAENLEPMCDVGRARYQEYLDSNKSRIATMIAGHSESAVGDPNLFMKEWAAAQQKAAAEQAEQIAAAVSAGISAGLAQMAEMMKSAMAPVAPAAIEPVKVEVPVAEQKPAAADPTTKQKGA